MRLRVACCEQGKESESFPWYGQCEFTLDQENVIKGVVRDCKTAGDIAVVNAGSKSSVAAKVRRLLEEENFKIRQLYIVTKLRPLGKRKRGAFCARAVKSVLLANRCKDLYHMPIKDSLDGSRSSHLNALLNQPQFDIRTKPQLTAQFKQEMLPHCKNLMLWPIEGCPAGTSIKKTKMVAVVKGCNPLV